MIVQTRPNDRPLNGISTAIIRGSSRYVRQCARCGRWWELQPARPDMRRGMCRDCHDVDPTFGMTQEETMQLIEALDAVEETLTPGAEMTKALIDTGKVAYAFLATPGEASAVRDQARGYLAGNGREDIRPSVRAVTDGDANGVRRYNLTFMPVTNAAPTDDPWADDAAGADEEQEA